MFAKAEDLNVLDDDHLIVSFAEDGSVDDVFDIVLIALGEGQQGLCVTGGCIEKALSVWVLADALKQGSDGAAHLL